VKSPSIQATSSDAAATGCLAVVYNLVKHIANPSWSHRKPSDPLPAPPASFSLAVDDDTREPFDLVLIQRTAMLHTVSGLKSR
jgi:hypothetical protein